MQRQNPPPPPPTAPHPVAKSIDERSSSPPQQVLSTSGEEKIMASATEEENKEAAKLASEDKDAEVEDEEQGECGFCLFMKGGGCKDSFIAWEKCVEEAEKNKEDIVEKCFEVTRLFMKCMDAHADYYGRGSHGGHGEEAKKELEEHSKVNAKKTGGSSLSDWQTQSCVENCCHGFISGDQLMIG